MNRHWVWQCCQGCRKGRYEQEVPEREQGAEKGSSDVSRKKGMGKVPLQL